MSWVVACPHCRKHWFTTSQDVTTLSQCPFCEGSLDKNNCTPRCVAESRLDPRAGASGCQIYIRAASLLDWLKKPDIHVCDVFDISEGGAGIFLSKHSVIDTPASETIQKVVIEGMFLDLPEERKRVITGPVRIPAEVRWVTGSVGDGRAGLKFLDHEEGERREGVAEIIRILRKRYRESLPEISEPLSDS
jgi:hypothetical protein